MGVVIQPLIDARLAGVLFTRNPISGAPERVIEASWGLGESVVQGRVVPDRYRLSPDGTLIELIMGDKRTEARPLPSGGVADHQVAAHLAGTPCLDPAKLRALHELTLRCEAVWPAAAGHDTTMTRSRGRRCLLCLIFVRLCGQLTLLGRSSAYNNLQLLVLLHEAAVLRRANARSRLDWADRGLRRARPAPNAELVMRSLRMHRIVTVGGGLR